MKKYKSIYREAKAPESVLAQSVVMYIIQRHSGNIKDAKKSLVWLKKNLGSNFNSYLMKFGDPDDPRTGGFNKVHSKWLNYIDSLG